MSKTVQISIKMDPELRDQFMAIAACRHRPAAQVIRELMRFYIAQHEIPNELTAETLRKAQRSEDVFYAKDAEDLFQQLEI